MQNKASRFLQKHQILTSQINYVIREEKRSAIYLMDGGVFYTYITMKDLLDALPQEKFLRVNKSYILSLAQIDSVINGIYTMKDGRVFNGRVKGKQDHNRVAQAIAQAEPIARRLAGATPLVRQDLMRAVHQNAMETLLRNYYRVLKVDLTDDSYVVIYDAPHQEVETVPQTISEWLQSYRNEGYVHPDDCTDYDYFTSLGYLRSYFAEHGTPLLLHYRRKMHDGFRWAMMELVPAEDYSPESQLVYLYVMDIHNSVNSTNSMLWKILQGLSNEYTTIFNVDFDRNTAEFYRNSMSTLESYGKFLEKHPTFTEMLSGYIREYAAPEERERLTEALRIENLETCFQKKNSFSLEYRALVGNDEQFIQARFVNISEEEGLHKMVVAFRDVTTEKYLKMRQNRIRYTVAVVSDDDELVRILGETYQVFRWSSLEAAEQDWSRYGKQIDLLMPDWRNLSADGKQNAEILRKLLQTRKIPIMPVLPDMQEGTAADRIGVDAADVVERPLRPETMVKRVESVIRLNQSTVLLERMKRDDLTGLYERRVFNQFAEDLLRNNLDEHYQILVSDIEDFKGANELYDRRTCDEMLVSLARLLSDQLPGFVMGARFYADKFAFLLKDVKREQLTPVLEKVHQWERRVGTLVNFGFTQVDHNAGVYANCDRARMVLNTIKGTYGVQLAEYDESLRRELLWKRHIATDAEHALHTGQFRLRFQPKLDLKTGKLGGAEMLVRWFHPELGMISPAMFIPQFERSGFVTRLDEYLCNQLCADMKHWQQQGLDLVPVSINLSRRDFENENLPELMCSIVDSYGLDHGLIHFEITESIRASAPEKVEISCAKFHKLGFCIELDDFGTGYSSLNTLSSMELDFMKIDKSLVDRLDTESGTIVFRQMLTLAKALGLYTVAEGVETREQLEKLKAMDCDYIQGYYYSRPIEKESFETFLWERTYNSPLAGKV